MNTMKNDVNFAKIFKFNSEAYSYETGKKIGFLLKFNVIITSIAFLLLFFDLLREDRNIYIIIADLIFIFSNILSILLIHKEKVKIAFNTFFFGYLFGLLSASIIGDYFMAVNYPVESIYITAIFLIFGIILFNFLSFEDGAKPKDYIFINCLLLTHYLLLILKLNLNFGDRIYVYILATALINASGYLSERIFWFHKVLYSKLKENEKAKVEAMAKIIDGFIPICANCKSIRGDKGEWVVIEEYIKGKSSNVEFTHGFCDKCMKKLYPDV